MLTDGFQFLVNAMAMVAVPQAWATRLHIRIIGAVHSGALNQLGKDLIRRRREDIGEEYPLQINVSAKLPDTTASIYCLSQMGKNNDKYIRW